MGNFNKQKGSNKAKFLKKPEPAIPPNPDDFPPAFSFEKMQDGSGHSFNCCEEEDRLNLAKRIYMLSRVSWRTIRGAPREGMGSEEISRGQIRHGIPGSVTEDVQFFHSLHYVGKKRFIGYRVGPIFFILWIDYNFKVYNH